MNIDIKETPEDFLESVQDLYPGDIFLVNRDNMEVKGETHHMSQQLLFFYLLKWVENVHLHKNPPMDTYSTCVHNYQTKKESNVQ